ncbi:hypothetical protein [Flavobacterium sp. LB1P71]|uniref:hypothetical protein n=1 Tax=Flavobacterium sp. LB1P71 TaxID=3401716 RepID=UPI003AACAC0F
MDKEIIYSFKEYHEKYTSLWEKYFLEYDEIEEMDFIINEIENYNICLKLVNFPIDKIFNRFWRVEFGINLKSFTISQEVYDFIFADENDDYYYKIYKDIVETSRTSESKIVIEKKIKQTRLIFPKIISFLETKKSELETPSQIVINKSDKIKAQTVFKDFFIDKINIKIINSIQEKCKEYNDKEMAFLIYLLHQEYKIISYSMSSRTKSRKHFVLLLKGIKNIRTSGIDRHFEPSGVKIQDPYFLNDNDYKTVKSELSGIFQNNNCL